MTTNIPDDVSTARWNLIRDTAVLQLKLVVDGVRDLLLVPASILAAIWSLVDSKDGKPGPYFNDVLAFGRRSERWIDLFGAAAEDDDELPDDGNIDQLLGRVEQYVVDEYRRGGITKQAKDGIDQALDALQKKKKKKTTS